MVSQDLLQGNFRGKEESLLFDVKWFSGSVVFRNALLLCGVCALVFKTLWCYRKTGGGINRNEEGREGKVGIGNRKKRREGVTRLIKLFYQSKLQNFQVQNFIFNKIFLRQIKLCT
jgi:hypothetical protein